MSMISDALSYPFEGEDSTANILLGGLLIMFSWLLLPVIYVFGYYVRVYQYTINGEDEPPSFPDCDVGETLVDGLKYLGVTIAYYLVPLLIFGVLMSIDPGAGLVLGGLVYLLTAYFVPAGIMSMVANESFTSAFQLENVLTVIKSKEYIVATLVAFGLSIPYMVFVFMVMFIPFIGWVLTGFLAFIFAVMVHYIYGCAYRNVMEDSFENN